MTVFDPSTLHRLVDDAECREYVLEHARTYRRMLLQRVGRMAGAILDADLDEAMDAALSLKVSSTMVGTHELAELATFLEADLRRQDLPAARARTLLLTQAADRARDALAGYLAAQSRTRPEPQLSTDSIR